MLRCLSGIFPGAGVFRHRICGWHERFTGDNTFGIMQQENQIRKAGWSIRLIKKINGKIPDIPCRLTLKIRKFMREMYGICIYGVERGCFHLPNG